MPMIQKILIYSGIVVLVLFIIVLFARVFKKKVYFLWSSLLGLVALIGINVSSVFTGVTLGYSVLSVGTSVVLGLPGVALALLVRLL